MSKVEIFTDGACLGNPGPGGYGAIIRANGKEKELSKGYKLTTNNRMELRAVIDALSALKKPCEVTLYSDSKYVVQSINENWLINWEKRGWKKADKKPVENVDLWQELLPLLKSHKVKFIWMKGHEGHPENERADKLSVKAANGAELHDDNGYKAKS